MIPIQKWHRRAQVGQKRAKNQSPFHTNTPLWRMHLPLSLIFCAARVFWCDLKQILERCSYKKLWKPTASTLSLRHGRTTKTERTAKPSWGPPWHLYQLRSTWQWAALEVEAQQAACFLQYCCMSNVREYKPSITRKHTSKHTSKHTWNILVNCKGVLYFISVVILLYYI